VLSSSRNFSPQVDRAGNVGYLIRELKLTKKSRLGDTITRWTILRIDRGFEDVKPMVFGRQYTVDTRSSKNCARRWRRCSSTNLIGGLGTGETSASDRLGSGGGSWNASYGDIQGNVSSGSSTGGDHGPVHSVKSKRCLTNGT